MTDGHLMRNPVITTFFCTGNYFFFWTSVNNENAAFRR